MVTLTWWFGAVVLAAAAMGWWLGRRSRRRHEPTRAQTLAVANAGYLTQLAPYRRWLAQYRFLRLLLGFGIVFGIVVTVIAATRPATQTTTSPQLRNRDIVLCLDVSTSMMPFDSQIVRKYSELVQGFQGERVALSVFNSTTRVVFPLTDDYDLVTEQLDNAASALDFDFDAWYFDRKSYSADQINAYLDFVDGTQGIEEAASLVGDGLASCTLQFDEAESDRSRSIVFATDNEVNDNPDDPQMIYDLPAAAELVSKRGIRLYSLYSGSSNEDSSVAQGAKAEYRSVTESAGGKFFATDDPQTAPNIIDDITAQQASEMDAGAVVYNQESPMMVFVLGLIAVAVVLIAAWRLRE